MFKFKKVTYENQVEKLQFDMELDNVNYFRKKIFELHNLEILPNTFVFTFKKYISKCYL